MSDEEKNEEAKDSEDGAPTRGSDSAPPSDTATASDTPAAADSTPEPGSVALDGGRPVHGVFAEYDTPQKLKAAAAVVRDAGYKQWDSYSPFPVHGLDPAMGIRPTVLPWLVLGAGLTGGSGALLLQWWTNAYDYPWVVSGKPFWSIPANIPITFELTVLLSALTAFFGMLMLNGLPRPSHPIDFNERFRRSTDDRFFILIEASDPKFDATRTRELLAGTSPLVVEALPEDDSPETLPWSVVWTLTIIGALALIPFVMFAQARASTNTLPQYHVVPNMDWQAKYKAQRKNDFFADGRAMRSDVEGTVAVGELREDDHFYRGKAGGEWARTFPAQVEVNDATMARGKQRFEIYCTPCHGQLGDGKGIVNERAIKLNEGTWLPPTNIAQDHIYRQPVGQLFNTVTNGIRNMAGYGSQIKTEDRWAVVLYLRALQRSRLATADDVPADARGSLK